MPDCADKLPTIIQGGMGVAVSNWVLAHAVSSRGQLGVVSGTGVDTVLARRLQLGDVGGHMRAAFDAFPIKEMADRVWDRYFVAGGKPPEAPFKSKPLPNAVPGKHWLELTVVANFVEVFLAKRGHDGLVGVNLLEKIQLPHLASLFGAMLAGVDFVLMGAGIPRQIPGALDSLSQLQLTEYRLDISGAEPGEVFTTKFDPKALADWPFDSLKRPKFLAIVSSTVLAQTLLKKISPPADGFVVELPLAGGHNAPPRGGVTLDENNEPIYGPKDEVDFAVMKQLGAPFWIAGAYGTPEMLVEALSVGAQGVQVGTAFAFCNESGLEPGMRKKVLAASLAGQLSVYTDPVASPTGFPFKVVQVPGTLSQLEEYKQRNRICDLGYLRTPYRLPDGTLGYRCASEPVEDYVKKGGDIADTVGRKCICNGLMATIGLGQSRKDGSHEGVIVTAGNDVVHLSRYASDAEVGYSASHVLDVLLSKVNSPVGV